MFSSTDKILIITPKNNDLPKDYGDTMAQRVFESMDIEDRTEIDLDVVQNEIELLTKNSKLILFKNVRTRDNKNLKKIIKNVDVGCILVSGYPHGLDSSIRPYITHVLVPKVVDTYTLSMYHSYYVKDVIPNFEEYKILNNNMDVNRYFIFSLRGDSMGCMYGSFGGGIIDRILNYLGFK